MKLVRFAVLYFEPNPIQWNHWELEHDGIIVEPYIAHDIDNPNLLRVIVQAKVKIDEMPLTSKNNILIIPEKPRKLAEKAIEITANHIAVSEMCKRWIKSPVPCVAFIPETEEEKKSLEKTNGFSIRQQSLNHFKFSRMTEFTQNNLDDRLDGISLFAEALANEHATGRLHELVRIFERAFKLSPHKMLDPLSEFLKNQGYSKKEIENWVYNLRDKSIHADKRDEFILESDVRPFINRIEQAAYDVLLNKKIWRDVSTERRQLSKIKAGVDMDNNLFTKGINKLTLNVNSLDPYGAYPTDFSAGLTNFPNDYWIKTVESTDDQSVYLDGGTWNIDLRES